MATAEDVFYLYERNSLYYHDCNSKNNMNPNYYSNSDCCCNLRKEVLPFTIGDQTTPCNFKVKCYIKPGDECPICYEPILMKSSAFITSCGHHFHKKCIFKYMETKWEISSYISSVKCPMCRSSLGHPDFVQRYRSSYFTYNYDDEDHLDKLEDFWISKNYKIPVYCNNKYNHYLGFNKSCLICKIYLETDKELL